MQLVYSTPNRSFTLDIRGKFNVIVGKSGTGKSVLADFAEMIRNNPFSRKEYPREITGNPVLLQDWMVTHPGSIIVIDEGIFDVRQWRKLIPEMGRSENYFVICTREGDPSLPYGINTTFEIEGTYRNLRMVPKYRENPLSRNTHDCCGVITEDAKVGYWVLQHIARHSLTLKSAGGKDEICSLLKALPQRQTVVFDSCGIGSTLSKLLVAAKEERSVLFDSASFEWEVLQSFFKKDFIAYTEENCTAFASEEQYYTQQLNTLLFAYCGINYSKNSEELASLFSVGCGMVQGNFCNMLDTGVVGEPLYEEFR